MKIRISVLAISVCLFLGTIQKNYGQEKKVLKKEMVRVSVLYPNNEQGVFNMEYYSKNHMPMVARLFGNSLIDYTIEKGMLGRTPDEPAPYLAIGSFYFKKLEDYEKSFGENAEKVLSDIPNYTNIEPIVQISEVIH